MAGSPASGEPTGRGATPAAGEDGTTPAGNRSPSSPRDGEAPGRSRVGNPLPDRTEQGGSGAIDAHGCDGGMEGCARNRQEAAVKGTSICPVTGERGFTYVELAVALSLVVLLIPVVFSLGHAVEAGMKEGMGRIQLQEE